MAHYTETAGCTKPSVADANKDMAYYPSLKESRDCATYTRDLGEEGASAFSPARLMQNRRTTRTGHAFVITLNASTPTTRTYVSKLKGYDAALER